MEDWRLNGQERYLFGKTLLKVSFFENGDMDHIHCDFCWATFSESEKHYHNGYATFDGYHIICEECFQDFKDRFQWKVDERIVDFEDYIQKRERFFQKEFSIYGLAKEEDVQKCGICGVSCKEKESQGKIWLQPVNGKDWLCQTCAEDFSAVFEITLQDMISEDGSIRARYVD